MGAIVLACSLTTTIIDCPGTYQPLSAIIEDYPVIAVGTVVAYPLAGDEEGHAAEFLIERFLTGKEILANKRLVPLAWCGSARRFKGLVFLGRGDNGEWFARGFSVEESPVLVQYVEDLIRLRGRPPIDLVGHAVKHLESRDETVRKDAFEVVRDAEDSVLCKLSRELPRGKLATWASNSKLPSDRRACYARLLGYCGTKQDAMLLRRLLDQPDEFDLVYHDVLIGYTLLRPDEGWDFICELFGRPDSTFLHRAAALGAAEFLYRERTDVVRPERIVHAMTHLLDQPDIADMAVDDFRRWQRWEIAGRVIRSVERADNNVHFLQRGAVLRSVVHYALSCPKDVPAARVFLGRMRHEDPGFVRRIEEYIVETKPE